jgi:hypothetical protein
MVYEQKEHSKWFADSLRYTVNPRCVVMLIMCMRFELLTAVKIR